MRSSILIAALSVVVVVVACSKPNDDEGESGGGQDCTSDCLAVPMGIKGLSFGMSESAAKDALKGARLRTRVATKYRPSRPVRADKDIPRKRRRHAHRKAAQTLPGRAASVKTTFGTEPAECKLAFAVAGKLSSIRCIITTARTKKKYKAVFSEILTRLRQRHGRGKASGHGFRWADDKAVLLLMGTPRGRGGDIALTNSSVAHVKLVAQLRKKADDRYAELLANERKAAEDAKRNRDVNKREAGKVWDRDLSGSPEGGQ